MNCNPGRVAVKPCTADVGTTVYFKHVDGGLVFAVAALCVLALVVHVAMLVRHERRSES